MYGQALIGNYDPIRNLVKKVEIRLSKDGKIKELGV